MKLHSDTLTRSQIAEALQTAKDKGHVAEDVVFAEFVTAGSRTRSNAWNIGLEALTKEPGDGRSRRMHSRDEWAATWEEWGWFIVELFELDHELVFGHYKTLAGFHAATQYKFA